jgi:hypothetical protein
MPEMKGIGEKLSISKGVPFETLVSGSKLLVELESGRFCISVSPQAKNKHT